MTIIQSAMRGVPVTLQDAQTSGNGMVIAIPDSFKHHTITIKGSTGVSAGAVQPETANEYNYAGTWAPLGASPTTVVSNTESVVDFELVARFLRVRITTPVLDGTVTVVYEGS